MIGVWCGDRCGIGAKSGMSEGVSGGIGAIKEWDE